MQSVNELSLPFIKKTFTNSHQVIEALEVAQETWIAKNNLGYVLLHHEDVSAFLKDSRWHTAMGLLSELNPNLTPEFKEKRKKGLMALNGQDHDRLKRMVLPAFSVHSADIHRPYMRSLMNKLTVNLRYKNVLDLQKEIFNYYPIPILCKLFGIPDADWKMFSDWSHLMFKYL